MLLRIFCNLFIFTALLPSARQHWHTIVSESQLFAGSVFSTLVTIHNATDKVQVEAKLYQSQNKNGKLRANPESLVQLNEISPLESKLIQLRVPADWPAGYYVHQVVGSGGDTAFNHTQEIFLSGLDQQYFDFIITLDTDVYIDGDTVRFSVLIVDQQGKTIPDGEVIEVRVEETYEGTLITGPQNVITQRGAYWGEVKVDKNCNSGAISIIIQYRGQSKATHFFVPQNDNTNDLAMKVELIVPQRISKNDSKLVATIKANYKCGFPIGGELTFQLKEIAGWFPFILPGPTEEFCFDDNCTRFIIENEPFYAKKEFVVDLPKSSLIRSHYVLYVKVTDQLTGRSRWTWKPIEFQENILQFSDTVDILLQKPYFAPGIPLKFQVIIKTELKLKTEEKRNAKLIIRAKYSNETKVERGNSNVEMQESSLPEINEKMGVTMSPPLDAASVILEVEISNQVYARKYLTQVPYNAANKALAIVAENTDVKVGQNLTVDIHVTAELDFITYQVTSIRSYSIIHWGNVNMTNKSHHRLAILVTEDFVSHFYLNVYGTTRRGDFVADNRHFVTAEENPLEISMDVEPVRVEPGNLVNFTIGTKANTIVFLKAWEPFGKLEDSLLLDIDFIQLLAVLDEHDWSSWKERESQETSLLEQQIGWTNTSHLQSRLFRPPRLSFYTNAVLQHEPSTNQSYRIPPSKQSVSKFPHKRSSFSRGWLWSIVAASDDDKIIISTKAPDRISIWDSSLIGIDDHHRIGHVRGPSIQVTKVLFLLLDVPPSLVRGEAVLLRVLVFQETKTDVNVTIVSPDERFQLLQESTHKILPSFSATKELKANESKYNASHGDVAEFLISPLYSGQLSVEAQVVDSEGNDDVIVQTIQIKEQAISEKPFVYDAKEAPRYGEKPGCLQLETKITPSSNPRRMNISFQVNSMNDQIGNLRINACIRYIQKAESDFLLEVELPSGFEITDERKSLNVTGVNPDTYDVDATDDRVRWYFKKIKTNDSVCPSIIAKRAFTVYNLKPAKVTAYTSFDLLTAKRAGVYYKAPSFDDI